MEKEAKKVQELPDDELKKVSGGGLEYTTNIREKGVCPEGCRVLAENYCVAAGRNYDQASGCCC